MAQLVLSNLGSAIGGQLAPGGVSAFGMNVSGAALGQLAGSVAGAAIDARYLAPALEGPRIRDFHVMESREGASVPVVYGRMRVGGQVIWAARFSETRETSSKGGPRTREYSYSVSFAVALCEGEIARVSRCWANGEAFDLSKTTWRLYRGTEDQAPDPLIEAIEGTGEAPAYRGLAYIVFEDLVVDRFGARLPQLSFEIVRPAGGGGQRLGMLAWAVNLIPGTGEFALATDVVRRVTGPGRESAENQNGIEAKADFLASIEQLEAELPGVSRVNLVVGWFGDDVRAGHCRIRPGVEIAEKTTKPWSWEVAGYAREDAHLISSMDGRSNYGGTPADRSVVQAVAALKARGYHVTIYPFLLMDTEGFPWRGRIAPGEDVAGDVAAFFGGDEGYRAFVLHAAELVVEAGADGVLIGSELVGLTRARAGDGSYPAATALRELAGDVREIVGPSVEISYAADWTEYGAHALSGDDVEFPLDALWADDAIDYVGLDWYAPMADWRDGEHADEAWGNGRSLAYLGANVAGGEAFDWYYANGDDRAAQDRLAIADGAHGEPWVFRQKDVAGWWGHAHHPRVGGVRSPTSTGWTPGMKPVRFVEFGCPAVDKGANQPNVFYDPKSSESALPHYSSGARDDLIQRRACEAFLLHWTDEANNPESGVYEGRMIPADGAALWAWDARPFPAFPGRSDVWADGGNWRLGHWLNGRVGAALLPDIVGDVCALAGVDDVDVSELEGVVSGYRFDGPAGARRVIEPLAAAFGIDALERDGRIAFRMRGGDAVAIDTDLLVEDEQGRTLEKTRGAMEDEPSGVRLRFVDLEADHVSGVVVSAGAVAENLTEVEAAVAMDRGQAAQRASALAAEMAARRDGVRFGLAASGAVYEPGDVLSVGGDRYRVVEVADDGAVGFEAVRIVEGGRVLASSVPNAPGGAGTPGEPYVVIVDAPPLPGQEDDVRPLGFAFAEPWVGPVTFAAGGDATQLARRGQVERPCAMGWLESALYPHVSGRWQEASAWVRVSGAALASRTEAAVLNGANAMLVETAVGWELVQFVEAELVDVEKFKLTKLLRGQQGTEPEMAAGAAIGARVVFLTGAERRLDLASHELGLDLVWRAYRESPDEAEAWAGTFAHLANSRRAWSVAHLAVEAEDGDVVIRWVRRARAGGDAWMAGEPPVESPERYRVQVKNGATILREWEAEAPMTVYDSADVVDDFPAGGVALFEVVQIGADSLAGPAVTAYLPVSPT